MARPATAIDQPFDLFLSFSSADRRQEWFGRSVDVVEELKTALERYRHPLTRRRLRVCTYDEDFELAGMVRTAITAAIDQSRAVLYVSGEKARASDFVRFELEHAARGKPEGYLLSALLNVDPSDAFPSLFAPGTLAADLSTAGCGDLAAWRRRVELEAAKLAARVWRVAVHEVRDRFLIERQRRRLWTLGASAVAIAAVTVTAVIGLMQYRGREVARVLAVHQRYAADMAMAQRAWTAGDVRGVVAALRNYGLQSQTPDPRTFEWYTYWRVAHAERLAFGHFANPVIAVAASPGRPWVAFATSDSGATVVDVRDGREIGRLPAVTAGSRALAFATNGELLALLHRGVAVWSVDRPTTTLARGPANRAFIALACAPVGDSCTLVDGTGATYVRANGDVRAVRPRAFRVEGGLRLGVSGDGRYLVGADSGGLVQVLDGRTHATLYTREVRGFDASHDIAVSGATVTIPVGTTATLLDLRSRQLESSRRLVDGSRVSAIAATHDGRLLAVADPAGTSVNLWQVRDSGGATRWREIGSVKGYRGWATTMRFIPHTTLIAAGSGGGDLKVWDLTRAGRRVASTSGGDVRSIAILPGTQDIVTLNKRGMIRRSHSATLQARWETPVGEYPWSAAALLDGDVAVADTGAVHVLDAATGKRTRSFPGWAPLASSTDGSAFAYVDSSGERVVVRRQSGAAAREAAYPVKPEPSGEVDITALALTARGETVLVSTGDGRIVRFDRASSQPVYEIAAHTQLVHAVAISPTGALFATASADQTVRLWEFSTGTQVAVLQGHRASVQTVAFSPDGATLAPGDQLGLIKLWNVPSRLETVTFYAHQADLHPGVTALAFLPDGSGLISGGAHGTIMVWDADTPARLSAAGQAAVGRASPPRR